MSAVQPGYRYDAAEWKRGLRAQRQRGCMIYIPAEVLIAAEIDPAGPPPSYRLSVLRRTERSGAPRVVVSLRSET